MQQLQFVATERGLHARPAAKLAEAALQFACQIDITQLSSGQAADAKDIFALMGLAAAAGEELELTLQGNDEAQAAQALRKLLKELFEG